MKQGRREKRAAARQLKIEQRKAAARARLETARTAPLSLLPKPEPPQPAEPPKRPQLRRWRGLWALLGLSAFR